MYCRSEILFVRQQRTRSGQPKHGHGGPFTRVVVVPLGPSRPSILILGESSTC